MPTLDQRSDVLAPQHVKILKFTGYHPSRFLKIIPGLMKHIFRLTSSSFFEDKIQWDVSDSEVVDFYGEWRGRDTKDDKTKVWIIMKLQGRQRVKDKIGNITIEIRANLVTNFPYSNFLDKALVRGYSRFFYSDQRRYYITEARERIEIIENRLKRELETMGDQSGNTG